MTPAAVVFDIGNVLIEWQPERYFDSRIGPERRAAMFAAVDLHGMNDRVDAGADFTETVLGTAAAHPDWRAEIEIWHDNWIEMASPQIDRSVRLMAALQAKRIPVFSLTNFGRRTYEIAAEVYPFLSAFDRDFISGHLGVIKPDPAIYAALETETGLREGALLFTDDRVENIEAARRRGWQTHLFDGPAGWAARLVAEGLLTPAEAA